MRWLILTAVITAFAFVFWATTPAGAQTETLSLELNKLEQTGEGCRFHMVIENGSQTEFDTFSPEFVVFDTNDVFVTRVTAKIGWLRQRRTPPRLPHGRHRRLRDATRSAGDNRNVVLGAGDLTSSQQRDAMSARGNPDRPHLRAMLAAWPYTSTAQNDRSRRRSNRCGETG